MTDPIADMLNRIINAQKVNHETLSLSFSGIKFSIASILLKEGFIKNLEKKGRKENRIIKIDLGYKDKEPSILGIKRVSKSGQRIYVQAKEIRPPKQGYGISIISTPKGLMTGAEARRKRLGGELICEIW